MKDFSHKFKNLDVVKEAVRLKDEENWSFTQLSKEYNCNRSSIEYQYRKYKNGGIYPPKKKEEDGSQKIRISKVKLPHCTKCELLLTSKHYCDQCKDLKTI